MKRLEIIQPRLTTWPPSDLIGQILCSSAGLNVRSRLKAILRERVANDLSNHRVHDADGEERLSPFGMVLVSALREDGMNDHSERREHQQGRSFDG